MSKKNGTTTMTVHLVTEGFAAAQSLQGLLARRRIACTTGDAALAKGAAVLVVPVDDAAAERKALDAARSAQARCVVTVCEGAPSFGLSSELGGRHLRVSLPATDGLPAQSDPGLLMLADLIAAPLRPMVACDPATGGLIDLAARVARTDVTVFINGPTGSGKEVLARAVHDASRRADKPFLAINCAAIPENMLEAVLFGHEKGAFTGAATANRGLIRAADGGTLMLDEISEMPLGLQAKLLRVLQERVVTPLGSQTEVPVDIRVIATSNRDMEAEIRKGTFREDLYYRLNVFPLDTMALADRPDDIPVLATAMLRRHVRAGTALPVLSSGAIAVLRAHAWPGNVRELENVMQRALVLQDGGTIEPRHIMLTARASAIPVARVA